MKKKNPETSVLTTTADKNSEHKLNYRVILYPTFHQLLLFMLAWPRPLLHLGRHLATGLRNSQLVIITAVPKPCLHLRVPELRNTIVGAFH